MTELKTRQQIRAEKRRSRKTRNLFETGLEALEVPTAVLQMDFTATEALLFSGFAVEFGSEIGTDSSSKGEKLHGMDGCEVSLLYLCRVVGVE